MANATAAQAYNAVRAIEAQMENTDSEGYHVTVDMDVALAKIIADNAGVTTQAEALFGIQLASGGSEADSPQVDNVNAGNYKAFVVGATVEMPEPGTNILFVQHNYTFVTSLSNPA